MGENAKMDGIVGPFLSQSSSKYWSWFGGKWMHIAHQLLKENGCMWRLNSYQYKSTLPLALGQFIWISQIFQWFWQPQRWGQALKRLLLRVLAQWLVGWAAPLRGNFNFTSYLGCGPLTVTVTTKIITFLIGNPYKPSFTTVTVRGATSKSYQHQHDQHEFDNLSLLFIFYSRRCVYIYI